MKNLIICAAIALLVGFGLGSQLMPKIEIKETQVEKEKIVKDVVTVTKIITKPDGSKEEVIVVTDKTKENKESKFEKLVAAKSQWHISVSAASSLSKLDAANLIYTVQAERRILGDLFLGAKVSTDKQIGLAVGIEF